MKIYKKIFEDEVEEGLDFDSVLKTSTDPVLKKAIAVRSGKIKKKIEKPPTDQTAVQVFETMSEELLSTASKLQSIVKNIPHSSIKFKGGKGVYEVIFPSNFEKLYNKFLSDIISLYKLCDKYDILSKFESLFLDNRNLLKSTPDFWKISDRFSEDRKIIIELEKWPVKDASRGLKFPGELKKFVVDRIHFPTGLPEWFQGYGLAYKIYLQAALTFGGISSDTGASPEITQTWAKLLTSSETYAFVWEDVKAIISKKVKDDDLLKRIITLIFYSESVHLVFTGLFKGDEDLWHVKDLSLKGLEKILRDRELFTRVKKIIESPKYRDLIVAKR